jgi:hypothetical protein
LAARQKPLLEAGEERQRVLPLVDHLGAPGHGGGDEVGQVQRRVAGGRLVQRRQLPPPQVGDGVDAGRLIQAIQRPGQGAGAT